MAPHGGIIHRSRFGDVALVAFLLAQACDGVLTYVGVSLLGRDVEGNPLLHWLMGAAGQGPALALAKLAAAGFGIVLHLASVHRAVALLTVLYVSAAVVLDGRARGRQPRLVSDTLPRHPPGRRTSPGMRTDPLTYLAAELDTLGAGLRRSLRELTSERRIAPSSTNSVVNLSSNNYLGLTNHPR
jgi:hypothetical protein